MAYIARLSKSHRRRLGGVVPWYESISTVPDFAIDFAGAASLADATIYGSATATVEPGGGLDLRSDGLHFAADTFIQSVATFGDNSTFICQFKYMVNAGANQDVFSCAVDTATNDGVYFQSWRIDTESARFFAGSYGPYNPTPLVSGVAAFTNTNSFLDGSNIHTRTSVGFNGAMQLCGIRANAANYYRGTGVLVRAAAYDGVTLSDTDIATLSAAMEALAVVPWYLPAGIVEGDVEESGTDLTSDTSYGGSNMNDADWTLALTFTAFDASGWNGLARTGASDPRVAATFIATDVTRVVINGVNHDSGAHTSGVHSVMITYDYSAESCEYFFDNSSVGVETGLTSMKFDVNSLWYGGTSTGLHYYVAYNKVLTSDQLTELHNNMTA